MTSLNKDGGSTKTGEEVRAEFEAVMRDKHPEWAFTADPVFDYHNERTRCAWEGYLAASSARSEEMEADKRDAERYRFLRNHPLDGLVEVTPCIRAPDNNPYRWALRGEEADAAIDAARAALSPKEPKE